MNARLCILSSSSRGNCSAIVLDGGTSGAVGGPRLILIDLGLSPRSTRRLLAEVGVGEIPIAAVVLTHLDDDHFRASWLRALPESTRVFLHRNHRGRAARVGLLYRPTEIFDGPFSPIPGVEADPMLVPHDDLGAAAFRFCFGAGGELGFATDVGRATPELVSHLRGVDVLAIESNYCPELQIASARPPFLKRRVMGGKGHLSNQQSAAAVVSIAPRDRTILLHLSLECNTPNLAEEAHATHGQPVLVSRPDGPTPWVEVECLTPAVRSPPRRKAHATLWEDASV